MSTAYQNLGDLDAALDCLRQIGIEQARIWNVLIDNLHPDVSSASSGSYRAGSYDIAVRRAIDALRLWRSRIPAQSDLAELSEFADAFIKASEVPEAQMVWQNSSIDAVAAIGAVHLIFTLAALRDQVGEERNS